MKISYLLPAWGHTGGSQVLYKFMDKLCERGHTVHAITPGGSARWAAGFSGEITKQFSAPPTFTGRVKKFVKGMVGERRVQRIKDKWPLLPVFQMNRGLLRNWVDADVTVATYYATAYAGFALSEKTIPLYHMQHWEEIFFTDELQRKMARLTYRLPLGLISNSSWLRQTVRERVGRDSSLLLPGVDTDLFRPRMGIREKFSSTGKIRIVSYYSARAFKGWPVGLEAMRKVFATAGAQRVEWLVYGGAPEELPDVPVQFVGFVFGEKLAELYSSAHIVFMPSWAESFPLPPIEAMACGAAVVFTGTGTEDYLTDGVNGRVCPARNPDALAEALLSLIENRAVACRFAEAGLETVKSHSWEAAVDQLEAILEDATNAKNPCGPSNGCQTSSVQELKEVF